MTISTTDIEAELNDIISARVDAANQSTDSSSGIAVKVASVDTDDNSDIKALISVAEEKLSIEKNNALAAGLSYSKEDQMLYFKDGETHKSYKVPVNDKTLETLKSIVFGEINVITPPILIPRINRIHSLNDENRTRFSGASWFEEASMKEVSIVGCGGIGSHLALGLSRIVAGIRLYDPDTVEAVNMAGQLYRKCDVGKTKVEAISNILYSMSDSFIRANQTAVNSTTLLSRLTCAGLDNMAARKATFEAWKYYHGNFEDACFIDGRLDATELQIFVIPGGTSESAEKRQQDYLNNQLFSDAEAEQTVCSFKQTTYLAQTIAGMMTNMVVNFINNYLANKEGSGVEIPFMLPYKVTYNSNLALYKTEYL